LFQRIPFQLPGVLAFQRKLTSLSAALPHRSSASLHPESKALNPSFEFWSHQTPASSHPSPRNSTFRIQAPSCGIQAGAGLHQTSTPASSHPPPRNPSIEFWSHQSFTPVRRIHLQEIQASHFGHFNPPSTSNRRRSMRLQSHHLCVIHICC